MSIAANHFIINIPCSFQFNVQVKKNCIRVPPSPTNPSYPLLFSAFVLINACLCVLYNNPSYELCFLFCHDNVFLFSGDSHH